MYSSENDVCGVKAKFPLGDFVRSTGSENKNSAKREKIRSEQVGTVPTFFCSCEQICQLENRLYSESISTSGKLKITPDHDENSILPKVVGSIPTVVRYRLVWIWTQNNATNI